MVKYYHHPTPFPLELGGMLPELTIAYHTYGTLNEAKDNVIWVCHALTANSDVADWLPHTVESGAFLDPERYFIVCANIIGSCYGTTSPLSINPETGRKYYSDFPRVTIHDMIEAHKLLAGHLGIGRIHKILGCSVGGFQTIEWAVDEPDRFDTVVMVASDAKASPWLIAVDETQRMAITADCTFGEPRDDAGMKGLAAARALALLTYRGPEGYDHTQQDNPGYDLSQLHRACTYQQYQGQKLCNRFDAYSYISILNSFDTHDVGRNRGGVDAALARIKAPVIVVGISTDLCFPVPDMHRLASKFSNASYYEINSPFGHDGFLVEYDQLNRILCEA